MICDLLEHSALYTGLGERFAKGFDFLHRPENYRLPPGRIEIDGDDLYAVMLHYHTQPEAECKLESHRRYADIQYIIEGEELMGFVSQAGQSIVHPYSEEGDYTFYESKTSPLLVKKGMFTVFFPQDLHRPCIQVKESQPVKKIVVKVRL